MTAPGASSLPQELVDIITSYLKDNKEALKTCGTLGFKWAESCRKHLFSSLTAPMHKQETLEQLSDFLQSSPVVCTYIQELCVTPSAYPSRNVIDTQTVNMFLEALPRLKVLSIQFLSLDSTPTVPLLGGRFTLRTLRMRCFAIFPRSTRTFMEILSLFSELGELHLQAHPHRHFLQGDLSALDTADSTGLHRPVIHSVLLECQRYFMHTLFREVLPVSPGVLKKLSAPVYDGEDLLNMRPIIESVGPQLEELELQISRSSYVDAQDWQFIFREHLSNMQTITFVLDEYVLYGDPLFSTVAALQALPATNLRRINLVFTGVSVHKVREYTRWPEFEQVLSRFGRLDSVCAWQNAARMTPQSALAKSLAWYEAHGLPLSILQRNTMTLSARASLAEVLPWVHERGLLRFE